MIDMCYYHLGAEPEISSKPSKKRGAPGDDDEPFERIVKRMMVGFSFY
jgi:hypothetical protein